MDPAEIDDALRNRSPIEPSAEFRSRVMRAVHAQAATGRPRVPVWRAIWPAVAIASVVAALPITIALLERSELRPEELVDVVRWLSFTVTGTVAIAWRTTRRGMFA